MEGGAWWARVHGVAKCRTGLSEFTSLHFMWFSRQQYWSVLPFSSLVGLVLSELFTMTHQSLVALHGRIDSFTELDKAVVHVIRLFSFL